ncbi:hypothetical protein PT286_05325 [Neisseriaceae bacterium ESL0693]|nr:hypothetical protein [Neisseriaceae bacterium ESL0693]
MRLSCLVVLSGLCLGLNTLVMAKPVLLNASALAQSVSIAR